MSTLKITVNNILTKFKLRQEPLDKYQTAWNGLGTIRANNTSDLLHEIAHYQVAPPERRFKANYGLGTSPDEQCVKNSMLVTYDVANREEELASVLGILWERSLGMDWGATYKKHGWADSEINKIKFTNNAKALYGMGLVSKNGTPKLCLNQLTTVSKS